MTSRSVDVVVVGAGLAGLTAAYSLARRGIEALVVERGEHVGAKNVFGGILYTRLWEKHLSELLIDLPSERLINRYVVCATSRGSHGSVGYAVEPGAVEGQNGYTILRTRFDEWLAGKARNAGAKILSSTAVRSLASPARSKEAIRVDTDRGEIKARAVILAEGVNGRITRWLGLGRALEPRDLAIAVKEILTLPETVIDERFQIWGGQGAAYLFIGSCLGEVPGGGFLYTNRDTLSVGVVVGLQEARRRGVDVPQLLARFKASAPVADFIRDASPKEYCAHLIPEGGERMQPALVGDGMLVAGDAAGFAINTGVKLRGADLAVASGLAAAMAVEGGLRAGDLSRAGLSRYLRELDGFGVREEIHRFRGAPDLLRNPRIYKDYPALACGVLRRFFEVSPGSHPRLLRLLSEEIRKGVGWKSLLKDGLQVLRSI